ERLGIEDAPDRVCDGGAVDDGSVDDAVGRDRLSPECRHAIPFAARLQLNGLDGARSDVEANDRTALAEQSHPTTFLNGAGPTPALLRRTQPDGAKPARRAAKSLPLACYSHSGLACDPQGGCHVESRRFW